MRMIQLAALNSGSGANVAIDLDALSGKEALLTDQEVTIAFCGNGVTGACTIQGDKTNETATSYANLTDRDSGAAVTSIAGNVTIMFNTKLPRFLNLSNNVSAGTLNIYAFLS